MSHDHSGHRHYDHPGGHPDHGDTPGRALVLVVALTLGYALVEAVAGWASGSLALWSDAGHMVTDGASLALAAAAAWLARRPPSRHHSYGLGRAEALAALFNTLLMVGVVAAIAAASVGRFLAPAPVRGDLVTWIALIGLGVNLGAAWLLMGGRSNINVRGALLHVLGDLLGSVAALVSGVVILYTGWTPVDPLLSLVIAGLILVSSLRLLRDALNALLDGVPRDLDLAEVGTAMAGVEGVRSVHDLHIWSLSGDTRALSAHVVLRQMGDWNGVLERLLAVLGERFRIDHVTLQPEVQETRVSFDPHARGGRKGSRVTADAAPGDGSARRYRGEIG
jgi:cobalt-zinc-cadmium efflux system protein